MIDTTRLLCWALSFSILVQGAPALAGGTVAVDPAHHGTRTPIQHLIVVIGENRSFDNVFATYVPKGNQTIWNLRSRGIVKADGSPGPNFSLAQQQQALNIGVYQLSPPRTGPYATLPQPNTTRDGLSAPPGVLFPILIPDPGLDAADQGLLLTGGTGQALGQPDCRYPADLPNGPFSITGSFQGTTCPPPPPQLTPVPYTSNTGDPIHRFYQMWQQMACSTAHITADNPSGCKADLYTWVALSVGWGGQGNPPPPSINDQTTEQGGVAMGFYNMAQGDFPYFQSLATSYAISDNYHQPFLGGTGINSVALGTGDVLFYADSNGNPGLPPVAQIEDPDPFPSSNNWYKKDGFGLSDPGNTSTSAYTNCSDPSQPGVGAILGYLNALPYRPFKRGNCAPNTYYLLNNNLPAYNLDGTLHTSPFSVGPSSVPTIGDALSAQGISWKYYGEGLDLANAPFPQNDLYCAICNPFQYATSIMTTSLRNNLQDLPQFYQDVQDGTLPAVSFVKPDALLDSHPGTSTPPLFEAFCRKLIDAVQSNPTLWSQTAILITYDEAGGVYDSGYIQPIDFFGDGPRIPLIAVSPFAKQGYVDHTYTDHASILKFIERNWRLKQLSKRSRDRLPNPNSFPATPYFPRNSPAIGDLMTLFDFNS